MGGDKHFIISAVNNAVAHETMAFEADEHGNLTHGYADVAAISDKTDHKLLLEEMGYVI